MRKTMRAAALQFLDRVSESSILDDHRPYNHVAFQVIGTRKVKYVDAGPLPARRVEFDDRDT
jgi:hypothetical protein